MQQIAVKYAKNFSKAPDGYVLPTQNIVLDHEFFYESDTINYTLVLEKAE